MINNYGFKVGDLIEQDKSKFAKYIRYQPNLKGEFKVEKVNEEWVWIEYKGKTIPFSGYWFKKSRIIKEEKMDQVKIVRKLEDLDGLENGMGLYIDSNLDVRVKNKNMLICYGHDLSGARKENYLGVLKATGFKFEYKPLRTIEEVLEEICNLPNKSFCKKRVLNYYIYLDHNDNKYKPDYCDSYETIGVSYMTQKEAIEYCNELNEIIGVGK